MTTLNDIKRERLAGASPSTWRRVKRQRTDAAL